MNRDLDGEQAEQRGEFDHRIQRHARRVLERIAHGVADDGISDQWETQKFTNLTAANASTDADGDGKTDREEHLADTNPLDAGDHLQVVTITGNAAGTTNALTWTSKATRQYRVLQSTNVATAYTTNTALGLVLPDAGATTTRNVTNAIANDRYYKVQSLRPLAP